MTATTLKQLASQVKRLLKDNSIKCRTSCSGLMEQVHGRVTVQVFRASLAQAESLLWGFGRQVQVLPDIDEGIMS